jgi:hypothetical protein
VKVVTRKEFAEVACGVNAGKASDKQDLGAVMVTCANKAKSERTTK